MGTEGDLSIDREGGERHRQRLSTTTHRRGRVCASASSPPLRPRLGVCTIRPRSFGLATRSPAAYYGSAAPLSDVQLRERICREGTP